MRALLFLALAWLAFAPNARAQAGDINALEGTIADIAIEEAIPGLAVAIIENGEIVLLRGYGIANRETNAPATANTIFRAASISKSLTGVGIMSLVERNALSLDDRLSDITPDVRFTNRWESTDPVRVAHLLEHSAGWPDLSIRQLLTNADDWPLRQSAAFAQDRMVSRWRPGLYSIYSNAGPGVAGLLIESASGESFDAYMRTHVMRPMGMAQADFVRTPSMEATLARSYDASGAPIPYEATLMPPSGGLLASAADLSALVLFYLNEGRAGDAALLTPAAIARIERQETTLAARLGLKATYGLGNSAAPGGQRSFRGHNGSIAGFTSVYGYDRRIGAGYVVLANGGAGVDYNRGVVAEIERYLLRDTPLAPPRTTPTDHVRARAFEGYYSSITPRSEFYRLYLDTLLLHELKFDGEHLTIGGRRLLALEGGLFAFEGDEHPSIALHDEGGRHYIVTGYDTLARQSPFWLGAKIAIAAFLALGALIFLALVPFRLWAGARGRQAGGGIVRWAPLWALAALTATYSYPLILISTPSEGVARTLASLNATSFSLFAISLAAPILAALGLWRAMRDVQAPTFTRIIAAGLCTLILTCGLYMGALGWIGVRTWTW